MKKKIVFGLGILAVLVVAGIGVAGWKLYYDLKTTKDEAKRIISEVGKIYHLPSEVPTVATVQDITKLKDQPFFNNAQNGDRLLIFSTTKQALVYREKTNQLINVGPITITSSPTPTATPVESTPTPTASTKK